MVRSWVKVSLSQYEKFKEIKKKSGRPLSGIIREAASQFLKKKEFPGSTTVSSLAKRTRNRYKSVSAYFPRSDWDLLREISKKTGKCKSELIREAVDEHLGRQA
ncbi:MAG: ribbon-helix-helix domain-containing protein [Candidatus Aerophobetes bacterium]